MTKEDTIYVKCCVLANSLKDTEDDLLLREDIKKIFTNTKKINYDIEHGNKYLDGIREHERYINQSDEYINDVLIPAGSWMQVLAITNQTLQEQLINKEINGVSLRTELGENVVLYDNTSGRIPYNNIKNKDSMQPSSISFTDQPANMLPLEIMNYQEYTAKTQKNNTGKDNMTNKQNESEVSFWRKLFTSKNATAQAPVTQPSDMFGTGANADEFMQSMIEANKSIPRQNELIEKLLESQTKNNEAIAKLGADIEKMKLNLSEPQIDGNPSTSSKKDNDQEPPEPPKDNDPKTQQQNKDKDPEPPQDPEPPEPPKDNDPKTPHTAKTSKPLRQTKMYQDQYEEEAMKFIANRSYEKLIGGQK